LPPRHQPGPNAPVQCGRRRTRPDRRADSRRLDTGRWTPDGGHQRAGRWTGGQQTGRTAGPRTTTPGDRTPDWLDTGRPDSRTPDDPGWVVGHRMLDTDRRPTPWQASWQCRPRRRPTLDAGWRLRRADTVWVSNNPRTARQQGVRGAPCCYGRAWPPPRPSAARGTPPSSWRLGAVLSSDDFGSSVERDGGGHPLWRCLEVADAAGGQSGAA
jgi:hypothetical protein